MIDDVNYDKPQEIRCENGINGLWIANFCLAMRKNLEKKYS